MYRTYGSRKLLLHYSTAYIRVGVLHFRHIRHPWRSSSGCKDDIQDVLVSREVERIRRQSRGVRSDCRGAAIYMVKEILIKYLYRHAGEYQHPVSNCFDLILAYARMTTK